jgi:Flp pilus assembly protein CpaB
MEMEYRDNSRRGRIIIILGVLLALVAGGTSFYLINNAQQSAGQGQLQMTTIVVAARQILARTAIVAADIETRQVPLDATNGEGSGVVTKPDTLIGAVLAIPVPPGQPIYSNMLLGSGGSGFSILNPDETIAPDSPDWRAVSLTIASDRAVAGLLVVGETVDLIMTATLPAVPASLNPDGIYIQDVSTKVTYQNIIILARVGDQYIFRCPLAVAEEIEHMQATGAMTFSAVLRPDKDVRYVDVSKLGMTTNRILQKYGLPFPQVYFRPGVGIPPQPPQPVLTPPPTPGASVAPSGSPAPSP